MWDYIDVHYSKGSIDSKWVRIKQEELEGWVKKTEADAYFSTIQRFDNAECVAGEPHICDFFMDFDGDNPALSIEDNRKVALNDVRKTMDYFVLLDVTPRIWFSGNKGFHLTVPYGIFGAIPDACLTYYWHHFAEKLNAKLKFDTMDRRVYASRRMWRINNTCHPKSHLYKIELHISELGKGIEYIQELAKIPRPELVMEDEEQGTVIELCNWLVESKNEYDARNEVADDWKSDIDYSFPDSGHPLCVQYLLTNGLAELGTKNRADMAFAGYCKGRGMVITDAMDMLSKWAESIPDSLTHVHNPKARQSQTVMVLKVAYANPDYHFSCGAMKACGIEVDCDSCPVKEIVAKEIGLNDYAMHENMGSKIRTEADVIGRDKNELIVPYMVTGCCEPLERDGKSKCADCVMMNFFSGVSGTCERRMKFDAKNKLTIEMLDGAYANINYRIKKIYGIQERCYRFKVDIEWGNAQIVYLSSRITTNAIFDIEKRIDRLRAVYLGHGIQLNTGYRLTGYVYPHSRTLIATFVIDGIEPVQSSLAAFTIERPALDELKIFQPDKGMTPLDKIMDIHKEFINSFIYIFGREELLMAVDIVFHSVRWINFQRQKIKGWLDILVLGDTRQGKSETVERLMKYYDLGTVAAGETCSRTGLLYTIHQIKDEDSWLAFGLLCRANGMLVVVDEVHEMNPADFKEFTLVRSKGFVDVKRSVYGVAAAETRLISIANCREGLQMASYSYPVQAITEIPTFKSLEDISRFDFAVGVRAGDLADSVINKDVRTLEIKEARYPPEICRNLVLWIWTRKPENIIINDDAETLILDIAIEMSQDYVSDIPLVEAADIRYKILRIATAFAGRTFHCDDGVNLVVTTEHIKAAYIMLDSFYRSVGLNYKGFSDEHARAIIPDKEYEALIEYFKNRFIGYESCVKWMLNLSFFSKTHIVSGAMIERSTVDQIIAYSLSKRFLVLGSGGKYKKTPQGRMFMQKLLGIYIEDVPSDLMKTEGNLDEDAF